MSVVALKGSGGDIEEPDWSRLIPDMNVADRAILMDGWRDFAHRHWVRICAELRLNETLSAVNGHQVQRLVMAYVRYDLACAKMMEISALTAAPKTGTPMLNLWQVEMRAADADATSAEMELCLNPRRRGAGTKVKQQAKASSASDGYLSKRRA